LILEGGTNGADGEDGGPAEASGVEIGGAYPVVLEVRAMDGRGGTATPPDHPAGDGGAATLGTVFGASDGASVQVKGVVTGGEGGRGIAGIAAGDGASVSLDDAVDGETAGALWLSQRAFGGGAGFARDVPGSGGAAESHLARAKSAASFELESAAFGSGLEVFGVLRNSLAADGAPGHASGRASNDAGSVVVKVFGVGGRAGVAGALASAGNRGGDGVASATAISEGDDHEVIIGGMLLPATRGVFESGAHGGDGGSHARPMWFPGEGAGWSSGSGGAGGNGRSTSLGIAKGASPVFVMDRATGGHGGKQIEMAEVPRSDGGGAHSRAIGLGFVEAPVEARAWATGGDAGLVVELENIGPEILPGIAPGGAAQADAIAIAGGSVIAEARAEAGRGTRVSENRQVPRLVAAVGGLAHATAHAHGRAGEALASARSNALGTRVLVRAAAEVLRAASVEARIGPESIPEGSRGRGRWYRARHDAAANGRVAPDPSEVAAVLAAHASLADGLAAAGVEEVPALGRFTSRQRQWDRRQGVLTRFEIELYIESSAAYGATHHVGFFAPRLPRRSGFDGLTVRIEKAGELIEEHRFEDARAARDFLDGGILDVGVVDGAGGRGPPNYPFPGPVPSMGTTVTLELSTMRPGARFEVGFLVGTAPRTD
jgi:hypothetical protein